MFYNPHKNIDQQTIGRCILDIPKRWITILKGILFDRHSTTTLRYFIHMCYACIHCCGHEYLKPSHLNKSTEFDSLKGAGCVSNFKNAVRIID